MPEKTAVQDALAVAETRDAVTAVKTEVIVHSSTFLYLQLLLNPQHAQFGRHFFRLVLLEFA